MSVIDNSNLGTLWNRILGLFSARKINNKSLAKDITINDEDIPSTAVNGETTVEGALGNIADQLSNQSQQIENLSDEIGDLTNLETAVKTDLVSAVNEIFTDNTTMTGVVIDIGSYRMGGTAPFVRKIGKLCIIQFFALQNLSSADSSTVIGTIPDGYRPAHLVQIRAVRPDDAKQIGITIYTDGRIEAGGYNGVTAGNIRASAVYFAQ